MSTSLNNKYLSGFMSDAEFDYIAPQVQAAHDALHNGTGAGNDFIGWLNLPTDYDKEEFARIKAAAERIKKNTDVFVVIGIGGSYLGARAAIEFLKSPNYNALKRIRRTSIIQEIQSAPQLLPSLSRFVRAEMFPLI